MPISLLHVLDRIWRGQQRRLWGGVAGVLVWFAAPVVGAFPPGTLYVADSTNDRVLAFRDEDSSGTIEPGGIDRLSEFYGDSSSGPDLSTPSHVVADANGVVYVLDGGTLDTLLALQDQNGDGDANDENEWRHFYEAAQGPETLRTPNSVVVGPDGALYVADDSTAGRKIVRLQDLNGNGNAHDDGEAIAVFKSPENVHDIESLAFDGAGRLYFGDSGAGTIFRLTDKDGDGLFLADDEMAAYFRGSETYPLNDIDCLAVHESTLMVCDEDTGVLLRLEDLNGGGSIAGEEEIGVLLDGSAAEPVQDTNDFTILADGTMLVLDGLNDTIFVVEDLNGDGDALDVDEVRRWLVDGGESLATPSGLVYVADPGPREVVFIRGNVVDDDALNVADPVRTLLYLFRGQPFEGCFDTMDADDDGRLNITDPVYFLNFLFGGAIAPPPPFPEPGPDPTDDELLCPAESGS